MFFISIQIPLKTDSFPVSVVFHVKGFHVTQLFFISNCISYLMYFMKLNLIYSVMYYIIDLISDFIKKGII